MEKTTIDDKEMVKYLQGYGIKRFIFMSPVEGNYLTKLHINASMSIEMCPNTCHSILYEVPGPIYNKKIVHRTLLINIHWFLKVSRENFNKEISIDWNKRREKRTAHLQTLRRKHH